MFRKLTVRAARQLTRSIAAFRLRQLLPKVDADAQRLLRILDATLRDQSTDPERNAMGPVEARRAALSVSTQPIELTDFGAGSPDAALSKEAMARGVIRHDTVGAVCRRASKSTFWTTLLFRLIREYRPKACIELGTCMGISASYQALALQMNNQGLLLTLEGSPSLVEVAQASFAALHLGSDRVQVFSGRFSETLPVAFDRLGAIDYAFIDGHHDEIATLDYFAQIKARATPGAVLVFDDIRWSSGMRQAWQTIMQDPQVRIILDLGILGICILGPISMKKQRFNFPMY